MYIEAVPNRGSPPAILLRQSFRENGRVRKRTLANLSDWPTPLVEGFRTLLKGGVAVATEGIRIRRALPHGHAAAVLGTIRAIGLDRLLGKPIDQRLVTLAIALIASRLISPASKLATARDLAADTAGSSLGRLLELGAVEESELYRALDWLGARQAAIETALARRHLKDGALVLYDVSSSWLEGRCCELARFGYSRDSKKGKLQIVYGLLCAADGCPVAVEVFEGNTADPMTLSTQIDKLKERFGLSRVVLVGDRGMITSARIRDELKPAGLDWITALRAPQIRALLDTGAFQLSLFDERDLAEITAPEFPGERLVVCKNPLLAEERARKREDLLQATEAALAKLADQIARGTGPRGTDRIARAIGRIENRYKLAKLFDITVGEDGFTFARNPVRVAEEARLDGFYVIRTNVEDKVLAAESVVGAYKSLARVERAFRSLKTVDMHLRPIHHWLASRVRAHVFLCMLACHVEWHMRECLKPMLFDDDDPAAAARERASIVAPAQSSPAALRKRASKLTANGGPVHSFQSLLRDLATCTLNAVTTTLNQAYSFTLVATPTPIQAQAFTLLDVDPTKL
ncbi:MAG TPA: IS1634 family transposase [Candidatus Dormibacteraeota bacterium]|jgi:Transposase DDE domain|nr:IS1634 family transposase [Candidatus Dormibacteraeota bacterium]